MKVIVDLQIKKTPNYHTFLEIISTVILTLPLIQVGQLSATGERMCIKYGLTDEA